VGRRRRGAMLSLGHTLLLFPGGGEVGVGEERAEGWARSSMLGRLQASCTWREGRGGDKRCLSSYLGVNAMQQGHGHGRPEQLKQHERVAGGVCAATTPSSVVLLCFPHRMPYTN